MPQDRRCCWTPAEAEEGVPSEGMQALRFWLRWLSNSSLVCDSSYTQKSAQIQVVPPQQREGCACIAAADPQLLIQHGDVEPGRGALLNLSHQRQLLAVRQGGPDPASLAEANLNARAVRDLQLGLHTDSPQGAQGAAQPQQIAAAPLPWIQDLQVLQPCCWFQPGLPGTAPAQLPDPMQQVC